MEVNQNNKKFYELAFIENGEYGYHGSEWHPSINEREINNYCEKDGKYFPATPLGFRDYKESRKQGLKNIFDQYPSVDLTNGKIFKLKRDEGLIKQYDKIKSDEGEFIVVCDNEEMFLVVDTNDKLFSVNYLI